MPNQVLIIEPQNELKFKVDFAGLFEQGVTTFMRLTNPTKDTVLFKIKTTAPKKYCVRPNSGILEPNSKVQIAISPQPVSVDSNDKHKHKFMVQSVIAPEGKINIDQVWKEINPDQMMDYKLLCVFESPRGNNVNDSGDNAAQSDASKKRVAPADESKATNKDADGLTQAEAKRKTDEDHVGAVNTANASDGEFKKPASEIIQLREEESKLRHEILQLKEELLRLRQSGGDGRGMSGHSYSPEKNQTTGPFPWLATAIVMALVGMIIGKFLM